MGQKEKGWIPMTHRPLFVTGIILSIVILGAIVVQQRERHRQLRWMFKQRYVHGLAFGRDGTAYVLDRYETVYVFHNGDENPSRTFALPLPATIEFSMGPPGDTLYLSGYDGVAAMESATGRTKWLYPLPVSKMVLGMDGSLYAGKKTLECLDAATGKTKWTFRPPPTPEKDQYGVDNPDPIQDVLTHGNRVFVMTGDPDIRLYALDSKNGRIIWQQKRNSDDHSRDVSLVLSPRGLLIGERSHGYLQILEQATGAVRKDFHYERPLRDIRFGTDGIVYSLHERGVRVERPQGKQLWETVLIPAGRDFCSNMVIAPDGTVLVGATPNRVCALDGKTGIKLWEEYLGSSFDLHGTHWVDVHLSPDGWVYAVSSNGNVYALRRRIHL
jgi:outer membrane protein assembly factor BamB